MKYKRREKKIGGVMEDKTKGKKRGETCMQRAILC